MGFFAQQIFFYRGYTQALFFLGLAVYVWFFPPYYFEGTWLDTWMDGLGVGSLVVGETLRVWAVSHAGRWTRSRRLKAPILVTTGPYAFVRHPIYLGNFLLGLGIVVVSDAVELTPLYALLFAFQYSAIVSEEERFLEGRFGADYLCYRSQIPKWIPMPRRLAKELLVGTRVPLKELGTLWGVIIGAFFFEWIESPSSRQWVLILYRWLTGAEHG